MISKHTAVMSVVIWGLTLSASPSQADVGPTPPRWSEADIADLNADLVALLMAEYRLYRLKNELASLGSLTRQKEVLGVADDEGLDFSEIFRKWSAANVVDPAMRIAENPAAPCKVAQIVLQKLLEIQRQAQLSGMDSTPGGDFSDPDSAIGRALKAVKRRCLEQAYDACLASGNGQHISRMLLDVARQLQLLSVEDAGFEKQAVYLYRRCTVYKLRYHSESKFDGGWFAIGSQSDGSIILLSDVDPAMGYTALLQPHGWKGPRPNDPIDALGVTTVCESQMKSTSLVCGSSVAMGKRGLAQIKAGDLAMERFYDEIDVNVTHETESEELERRAKRIPRKPSITWKRKSEGTNALALAFWPWPLQIPATFRYDPRLPPVSVPVPDSIIAFWTVHQNDVADTGGINIKSWTRAGHDVLFEKTFPGKHTDRKLVYTDTTRFELVHRPDLFPSDEIVPHWELTPAPQAPAATRQPLRPPVVPR